MVFFLPSVAPGVVGALGSVVGGLGGIMSTRGAQKTFGLAGADEPQDREGRAAQLAAMDYWQKVRSGQIEGPSQIAARESYERSMGGEAALQKSNRNLMSGASGRSSGQQQGFLAQGQAREVGLGALGDARLAGAMEGRIGGAVTEQDTDRDRLLAQIQMDQQKATRGFWAGAYDAASDWASKGASIYGKPPVA